MKQMLFVPILLFALWQPGYAQGRGSALEIERGCKEVIGTAKAQGMVDAALFGECIGTVGTIMLLATSLNEPARICRPTTATLAQATRIVLSYLDKNPNRLHEQFKVVAVDALKEAWPCRAGRGR